MLIDVSHLSDRGFWDVRGNRPAFVATHSDSRALVPQLAQPHRRAVRRDRAAGLVGINLYTPFLVRQSDFGD